MRNGVDVKLPENEPERRRSRRCCKMQRELAHPRPRHPLDRSAHPRTRRSSGCRRKRRRRAPRRARRRARRHDLQAAHAAHAADSGATQRGAVRRRRRRLEDRLPDRAADADGARRTRCAAARIAPRCSASAISARAASRRARSSISKQAEGAIRLAIDAAERMAGAEVQSVIVNMSGGRLSSQRLAAKIAVRNRAVGEYEMHRVIEAASAASSQPGRAALHAIATGFRLDAQTDIRDPRGMVGEELGAELAVASCDAAAARNLMLAIERCHLKVEAMVASPYAAGLSSLVDDEAEIGAALVDFGGGSTTIGVFHNDRLTHVDAIAVGGNHVTHGRRARPFGLARRRRTAEDALRRLHLLALRRSRDDRGASRRRRRRSSELSAEVGTGAHHPAARRGNPRTGARPAEGGGPFRAGRAPAGADRRRQPTHRPAGTRAHDRFAACAGRTAARRRGPARIRQDAGLRLRGRAADLSAGRGARAFRAGARRQPGARRTMAMWRAWGGG